MLSAFQQPYYAVENHPLTLTPELTEDPMVWVSLDVVFTYHKASNTPKTYVPRKGYVGSLQDSPQDSWSLVKMYKDKILNYSSCRTWMILHKSIKNRKNKNMWRRTKFRTVVPHLRLISWRDLHKILDRMCYQKEWILGKPKR